MFVLFERHCSLCFYLENYYLINVYKLTLSDIDPSNTQFIHRHDVFHSNRVKITPSLSLA